MRRHPEYRFFYLHYGYPEVREYFFVLTENIPESENDTFLSFVNTTARTFGFIEGVLMKPDDFKKHIAEPMEKNREKIYVVVSLKYSDMKCGNLTFKKNRL